jgi:Ca2+-binding RTX toxin-like protein
VTLAVTDASDPLVTDVANAAPVDLTVTNVAPQNLAITGPDIGVRGQTLTYTSNFTDPGVNDTFTYAWSVTRNGAPYVLPAGTITNQPTFTFTPTFAGSYVVSLTVTDNAGAATTATHNLSVVAVTMEGNDLFVGGTTQSDHIVFVPNPMHVPGGGKPVMGVRVFINSVSYGTFQVPGSIIAFGQTGNDNIQTAGSIQNDTILFGGGGNDRLKGGAGNNVLVGGDGNDLLLGGRNNDIIIGGNGLDRINGGAGDDILIGDRTTFDTDYVVLGKIMDEWSSSSSYADRVSHLSGTTGGLNDGNFLLVSGVGQTVQDDGSIDRMQGAAGMDWFLSAAGTDLTFGKHPDEQLNN